MSYEIKWPRTSPEESKTRTNVKFRQTEDSSWLCKGCPTRVELETGDLNRGLAVGGLSLQ